MKTVVVNIMKRSLVAISLMASMACAYLPRPYGYIWAEPVIFSESGKELNNPNRGFYYIYGFTPSDGTNNSHDKVFERLEKDESMVALIQINLKNYSDSPISGRGLRQIAEIFKVLKEQEKQYVVRFLYDWDGRIAETEPEQVETILNHMNQLEIVFREYEDIIFLHQGLFVGNWGELNGTKHADSIKDLAVRLTEVTGNNTFLSVRTPLQWRKITGLEDSVLKERLGLFNDGMMGNSLDCGTYGTKSKTETGALGSWNREEELEFQSELCRYVPNGGEVIIENPLNDFEEAVTTLRQMHVSYLNRDYDRAVLNKWAGSTVMEEGCFYGMDGLTYIERHLGYRLHIVEADITYNFWKDRLTVSVGLKNTGFAPLYREYASWITIYDKETGEPVKYLWVTEDLKSLAGGLESEQVLFVEPTVNMNGLDTGTYEVYLTIKDVASGRLIELANEQELQEKGYCLGEFFYVRMPAEIAEE